MTSCHVIFEKSLIVAVDHQLYCVRGCCWYLHFPFVTDFGTIQYIYFSLSLCGWGEVGFSGMYSIYRFVRIYTYMHHIYNVYDIIYIYIIFSCLVCL